MQLFPFFIECSKYYETDPFKKRLLQKMAIGQGIHVIKRKDKNVLVTGSGEFVIPSDYSDDDRKKLETRIWKTDDFTRLGQQIEDTRKTWVTMRKKDRMCMIYKYVSTLSELSRTDKITTANILILALLLKMIKNSDVVYENSKIVQVSESIKRPETFETIKFVYDYSVPASVAKKQVQTFTTVNEDEDDD